MEVVDADPDCVSNKDSWTPDWHKSRPILWKFAEQKAMGWTPKAPHPFASFQLRSGTCTGALTAGTIFLRVHKKEPQGLGAQVSSNWLGIEQMTQTTEFAPLHKQERPKDSKVIGSADNVHQGHQWSEAGNVCSSGLRRCIRQMWRITWGWRGRWLRTKFQLSGSGERKETTKLCVSKNGVLSKQHSKYTKTEVLHGTCSSPLEEYTAKAKWQLA